MSAHSIYLRKFCPEEIVFDDDEVREILAFFFPNDKSVINNVQLTHSMRSFAQGMLLAAVDRSHDLSVMRRLINLVYRKHTHLGRLLRKLRREAPREWFRYARGPAGELKVAEPVRVFFARNFRRVFLMLVNGTQPQEELCMAFMAPERLVGAKVVWG